MTTKRWTLIILSLIAAFAIASNLLSSFTEPQFQSRLELYQTDLILQASELQLDDSNFDSARKSLLGENPTKPAIEAYSKFLQSTQDQLTKARTELIEAKNRSVAPEETVYLEKLVAKNEKVVAETALRMGVLQAETNDLKAAQATWQKLPPAARPELESIQQTASAVSGLFKQPPQIVNDADALIKKNLDGWFRDRSLTRLYQLQQRQTELNEVQAQAQIKAEQAFSGLAIATSFSAIGGVLGAGLILFLLGQWAVRRKQSVLTLDSSATWPALWDWEAILQVLLGFLLVGQAIVPLGLRAILQAAGVRSDQFTSRGTAFFFLINYLLVAAVSLAILYFSIRPFLSETDRPWFRIKLGGKWILWGLGGYLVAIPIVTVISLVNQAIWQGKGGSNPLLPIALQGRDGVALTIFFVMAAIAAPIFEEILFRGFLLPSLTRYLPMSGAIAASALIFAIAHLSLAEILPLTVLGMILGFVYVRSQNLLASIMIHSLWNAGTLISLFVLGGASN